MEIVKIVRAVTNNIKTYFPTYDGKGYEIAGIAWHQGWNDRIDAARAAEYESNLKWFIKDIRDSLKAPLMPFATANMGAVGWTESFPPALAYFKGMEAVTNSKNYPEFVGNVAYVETRDFWRAKEISPADQLYHWNRNAESYFLVGKGLGDAMIKMLSSPTSTLGKSGNPGSKEIQASSRFKSSKVLLEYQTRNNLQGQKPIVLEANGKAVVPAATLDN
jgi:alpha-galactosidase